VVPWAYLRGECAGRSTTVLFTAVLIRFIHPFERADYSNPSGPQAERPYTDRLWKTGLRNRGCHSSPRPARGLAVQPALATCCRGHSSLATLCPQWPMHWSKLQKKRDGCMACPSTRIHSMWPTISACRQFAEAVHRRFGARRHLRHQCGAVRRRRPFLETTIDRVGFRLSIESSQHRVVRACSVAFTCSRRHWGRIVTITSVAVKQACAGACSFELRYGLECWGWFRSLATQFGPDNITINNVGPGYTATARMKETGRDQGRAHSRRPARQTTKAQIAEGISAPPPRATGRGWRTPIVWLASERASYVTGQKPFLWTAGLYRGL